MEGLTAAAMVAPAGDGRASIDRMRGSSVARIRSSVVRLALGDSPSAPMSAGEWRGVLLAALEERCAPLAWVRSSSVIQSLAPREVAAQWRASALASAARSIADFRSLCDLYRALDAAGVPVVVLKGAPLAVRLYGHVTTRPCSDIDVFVPVEDRDRGHASLTALGWQHTEGLPPWDESYVMPTRRGTRLLEVHSSLVHARFGYLDLLAPEIEMLSVEGVPIRCHGGDSLAAYLAVHLAAHQFAPLLWWLDLATLWEALSDTARDAARRAARRSGADRYLSWALRRVEALHRLADGDYSAGRRLGFATGERRAPHPMWRHLRLAPSAAARRAALADWLWPKWMGDTYGANPLGFARRVIRHAGDLLPRRRPLA